MPNKQEVLEYFEESVPLSSILLFYLRCNTKPNQQYPPATTLIWNYVL